MGETSHRASILRRSWLYLSSFIKRPTEVASLIPSSRFVIDHFKDLPCFHEASTVIELGAGDGGTTQAILSVMPEDGRLLAVELVRELAEILKQVDDPRCLAEQDDARNLDQLIHQHQLGSADVVVSGIPFSNLSPEVSDQIIEQIYRCLKPDGVFLAYQFRADVADYASPRFGEPETTFIPWNLPPLQVYQWQKVTVPVVDPELQPIPALT